MNPEYSELLKRLLILLESKEKEPFSVYTPPRELERKFDFSLPAEGKPFPRFSEDLSFLLENTPSTARMDFANQLFGGREDSAVLGEMLAAYMNISMYTYKVGGAMIIVEREILSALLRLFGFAQGEGQFVPGGSMANLCCMLVARNTVFSEAKEEGMARFKPVIYTSAAGHYSIPKNANILGLGRSSVRAIPTDSIDRIDLDALRKQIQADKKAGLKPFLLNGTAGTTVLGAFDDLSTLADIAKEESMWFHVDASWGGGVVYHPEYRKKLAGAERANSLSYNPHKMTGLPLQGSIALFSKKDIMAPALTEQADYLFQTDREDNPGISSLLCGRRNDALKFWCLWNTLGTTGLAERVSKQFENTQTFVNLLRKRNADIYTNPEFINVCFNVPNKPAAKICELLHTSGVAKIGYGSVKKGNYIRMVCVNPKLDNSEMEKLLDKIFNTEV